MLLDRYDYLVDEIEILNAHRDTAMLYRQAFGLMLRAGKLVDLPDFHCAANHQRTFLSLLLSVEGLLLVLAHLYPERLLS